LKTICFSRYPCLGTARLLLQCGASIDAIDYKKNTPLHLLLKDPLHVDNLRIVELLLTHSAHPDYINSQGQTPLQLIPSTDKHTMSFFKSRVGTGRLKCLCARLITQQRVPYGELSSTSLAHFIQRH
jgi:ankyrin repeat protein